MAGHAANGSMVPPLPPCRRVRGRWFVLFFLLLPTLALLAGGCGAEKTMIPSALDTRVIDIKAEPGPAELPPRSTGVPAEDVLEMLQWIAHADGRELYSQRWYDFKNERLRWDTFGDPAFIGGGPSTTVTEVTGATILYAAVIADGQEISYDAFTGELRSSSMEGPDAADETTEEWGTKDVVLLGRQMLNGVEVDVYRLDLNVGHGQERSADFGLIYVDSSSGVRLREEWLLGSPGDAWVYHLYQYQLVPRTAELEARLTPRALVELAAQNLHEKLERVAGLDFPVWGLPEGAHGLVLAGIIINQGGVRLAYAPQGQIGVPVVSIETTDFSQRSDYPLGRLTSREEAVACSGGTDHIDFRMNSDGDKDGAQDGD